MIVRLVAFDRIRHQGKLRYAEQLSLYILDALLPGCICFEIGPHSEGQPDRKDAI